MKTKKASKITSYTLLPNGIWIETLDKHLFCWHQDDDYLTYSQNNNFSSSNIVFIRGLLYLYNQLFAKYFLFLRLKRFIAQKTNHKFPSPITTAIKDTSMVKILITTTILYYLLNLQIILENIYYLNFPDIFATLLSLATEFLFLSITLLIIFRLFIPIKIINLISRYNQAFKDKNTKYIRNNTVFLIVSVILTLFYSSIVNFLTNIHIIWIIIIFYPLVFEILTYCEKDLGNYLKFLIYSPIYLLDHYFTSTPTKKEQKCVTLALK